MGEGNYEAANMFKPTNEAGNMFKPTKPSLEERIAKHKYKMELLRTLIGVLVVVMQSIILYHIIIK